MGTNQKMGTNQENAQQVFDRNTRRAEVIAWLIVLGLALDLVILAIEQRPFVETALQFLADLFIVGGVAGELYFERKARVAGDTVQAEARKAVAEAEARATEAQARAAEATQKTAEMQLKLAEAELRLQQMRQPRLVAISDNDENTRKLLDPYRGTRVNIFTVAEGDEIRLTQRRLAESLARVGWDVAPVIQPHCPSVQGIRTSTKRGADEKVRSAANAIYSLLASKGIGANLIGEFDEPLPVEKTAWPMPPGRSEVMLQIEIGFKPPP
jgi:hypothetical protein